MTCTSISHLQQSETVREMQIFNVYQKICQRQFYEKLEVYLRLLPTFVLHLKIGCIEGNGDKCMILFLF